MRLSHDDAGLSLVHRNRFHLSYEGDTSTGARVGSQTRDRARGAVGRGRTKGYKRGSSRAQTRRGKQRAVARAGAADETGRLFRQAPGRKLTTSQVTQRTRARRALKNAGTDAGRVRTRSTISRVKRAARRARLRRQFAQGG